MKSYLSKSSVFVKIATSSSLLIMVMILFSLITIGRKFSLIGAIILIALILGTLIYFYSNSLNKILLEKDAIILKKNIGQIHIPKSSILEVSRLCFSNLTMTYGSKGFFGFIGKTMDGSSSFVKDRKKMIRITTTNKKYIVSSENADELIREIKSSMQTRQLNY
ncbi:MAG TPA: PH domain-containing protein [Flavobacteriaceae bacterium]|nr:PH domain-containing protein [Flavobacteriaceae bacterium]